MEASRWRQDRITPREQLLVQNFPQMEEKPCLIIFPGLLSFSRFSPPSSCAWYPKSHAQSKHSQWLSYGAMIPRPRSSGPSNLSSEWSYSALRDPLKNRSRESWMTEWCYCSSLSFGVCVFFSFLYLRLDTQSFHKSRKTACSQQGRAEYHWIQRP